MQSPLRESPLPEYVIQDRLGRGRFSKVPSVQVFVTLFFYFKVWKVQRREDGLVFAMKQVDWVALKRDPHIPFEMAKERWHSLIDESSSFLFLLISQVGKRINLSVQVDQPVFRWVDRTSECAHRKGRFVHPSLGVLPFHPSEFDPERCDS